MGVIPMLEPDARRMRHAACMSDKPFSPAAERNREPILAVLREHFAGCRHVLEIGSGTGQHAVHFAAAMPWLLWQCSDRADCLAGIREWLDDAGLANTPAPIELDVGGGAWLGERWGETDRFDAVFSANTLHIMGWTEVEAFFDGVAGVLADSATVVVYGPFNYGGAYTSDSNREFDGWLKARDPHSGIRDFEAVDALARAIGLRLVAGVAMPANNRCLVWRREPSAAA
jgi:cyclopropane fatty-acyl-phospholipid synthase-like methyltransferase